LSTKTANPCRLTLCVLLSAFFVAGCTEIPEGATVRDAFQSVVSIHDWRPCAQTNVTLSQANPVPGKPPENNTYRIPYEDHVTRSQFADAFRRHVGGRFSETYGTNATWPTGDPAQPRLSCGLWIATNVTLEG
jgi:hypothetical protein